MGGLNIEIIMWIYESYFELQIKIWKWTWSLQLNKKPRQLKKEPEKIHATDQFTWVGSRCQQLAQIPQPFTVIPSLFETLNSFPETAAWRQWNLYSSSLSIQTHWSIYTLTSYTACHLEFISCQTFLMLLLGVLTLRCPYLC